MKLSQQYNKKKLTVDKVWYPTWPAEIFFFSIPSSSPTILRFPAMLRPPRRPLPLLLILLSVLLLSVTFRLGMAHRHHGEEKDDNDDNDDEDDEDDEDEDDSSCKESPGSRVIAEFRQGLVTIDGRGDEWADVVGLQLALLPALDFDEDKAYAGGTMTVKVSVPLPFFLVLSISSAKFCLISMDSTIVCCRNKYRNIFFIYEFS